jgi:D-3-phosphoglycerate dehydrogenase
MLSLKLHTSDGERWVEGTVFEPGRPRLTLIDGVSIEAPLEGTLLIINNEDLPGVIGEVGTILGRRGLNIATFSLGRQDGRNAFGVVNLDRGAETDLTAATEELRTVPAIRRVAVVRL